MTNNPTLVATLPPGTYIVGDPCYSIGEDHNDWMEWLEAADYTQNDRNHVLVAPYKGRLCVGVSTKYGDGEYYDNQGNSYGVDAGLVGLVAIEVSDRNSVGDGRVIVTFDEEVDCFYEDGLIHLGHIEVETNDVWECEKCGDTCEDGSSLCSDCEAWECEDCGAEVEYGDSVCAECDDLRHAEDEEDDDE
jgi:hypothetical protein